VRRCLEDTTHERLGDIGTVDALRVLPLVDRRVQRPGLRGEPGVSYLVRAGGEVLLFDTGLNLFGRSRSALVGNAEALGVDLAQVPAVVLSHRHEDHVGGLRAQRARSFAFSGDPVEPPGLVGDAPVPLTDPSAEVRVTTRATVLAPGVALLPPLPAALFWDGAPVLEQSLVVNVRGAGLVLVSGCGHPGAAAMLNLAREVLDVPLHGVIGGLHLPVRPWPRHVPQALTGSPRPPWRPLSDPDINVAVAAAAHGRGVAGGRERARQHAAHHAPVGGGVRSRLPGGRGRRRDPRRGPPVGLRAGCRWPWTSRPAAVTLVWEGSRWAHP